MSWSFVDERCFVCGVVPDPPQMTAAGSLCWACVCELWVGVAFPGRSRESFAVGYQDCFFIMGMPVEAASELRHIPDIKIQNPMVGGEER